MNKTGDGKNQLDDSSAVNQDVENAMAQNWLDLAGNFKEKVSKRASEISYMHTRAGFIIAGSVIAMQILLGVTKLQNDWLFALLVFAALCSVGSLILAAMSMFSSKSTTPLKPEEMILTMTEQNMTRQVFGVWLAKSYSLANKSFNDEYNKKYNLQVSSVVLLIISLVAALILKGIQIHA